MRLPSPPPSSLPASLGSHLPLFTLVLTTATSDLLLHRLSLFSTYLIFSLQLLSFLAFTGGCAFWTRSQRRRGAGGGGGKKEWKAAAAMVLAGVGRVFAARWNRSWVWTGVEAIIVPLIVFFLPPLVHRYSASSSSNLPSGTSYTPMPREASEEDLELASPAPSSPSSSSTTFSSLPSRTPSPSLPPYSPSSLTFFLLPSLVGLALLATDLASVWGVGLAILAAGVEGWQWVALREVVTERGEEGGEEEWLERVGGVTWRAALLHLPLLLILHLLGILDTQYTKVYSLDVASFVGWVVASGAAQGALSFLLVSTSRTPEEGRGQGGDRGVTTVLAAKNAVFLFLSAAVGPELPSTGGVRAALFLTYTGAVVLSAMDKGRSGVWNDRLFRVQEWVLHQTPHRHRLFALSTLLPLSLFFLTLLFPPCRFLSQTCPTLDLVISHYTYPLPLLASNLRKLRTFAPLVASGVDVRVVVYHKGEMGEEEIFAGLAGEGVLSRERGDEVILLPNYGREGATYLRHILRRYDASATIPLPAAKRDKPLPYLADQTIFLQDHPPRWDFLLYPRLTHSLSFSSFTSTTRTMTMGFMSLAPYLSNLCSVDSFVDGSYPGVEVIKSIISPLRWPGGGSEGEDWEGREERQKVCEQHVKEEGEEGERRERVAATWGGQFVVSRGTVLRDEKGVYERLVRLMEAPDGDPIHDQWNPQGPSTQSNPAFGHSLERAWPVVFHCADPSLQQRCPEARGLRAGCGCWEGEET